MKLIRTNIEHIQNDKKTLYKLTRARGDKMSDREGKFPVDAYLLYEDENSKGEIQEVLAVLSGGEKLETVSPTFIREFNAICDIMGNDPFAIIIVHGKSKGGRNFITCELDCD